MAPQGLPVIGRFRRLLTEERVTLLLEEETARLLTVRDGRVLRWGSAPIPRDSVLDGQVVDAEAVARAISRLWDVHQAPREGIILGVPGVGITTRLLPMVGAGTPTDEEIRLAAAQTLNLDEVYLDWQMVGVPSERAVYVLAVPRSTLDSYLAALDLAGLSPIAVDLKQLALIRAVGQRHAVLADLERAVLSVVVVDEALPRLVRIRPLLAPLVSHPDDKVTRLTETLAALVRDYNDEPTGNYLHPAVPVHLTGALADQSLLREAIQVGVGRTALLATPPFGVPADMPVPQYVANMGLALKSL